MAAIIQSCELNIFQWCKSVPFRKRYQPSKKNSYVSGAINLLKWKGHYFEQC